MAGSFEKNLRNQRGDFVKHVRIFWERRPKACRFPKTLARHVSKRQGRKKREGGIPKRYAPSLLGDACQQKSLYLPVAAVGKSAATDAVGADLNAQSAGVAVAAHTVAGAVAAHAAVGIAAAVARNAVAAVVAAAAVVSVTAVAAVAAAAVTAAAVVPAVAAVTAAAAGVVGGAADTAHVDHGALGDHGAHAAVFAGHLKFQRDLVVFAKASDLFAAAATRQEKVQTAVDAVPGVVHGSDIRVTAPANGQARAFCTAQNLINLLAAQNPAMILAHKKSHPFGVN